VYKLLFHRNVEKQLSKIPRPFAEQLAQKTRQLKIDPRPSQSKQLDREIYRLRDGDYRVVYAIFDAEEVVYVGKIERRTEKTYRNLKSILARARIEVENQG
jgi:mRNA interferase RelE/StbE